MNRINIYILILTLVLLHTSCEDCEDLVPKVLNDSSDSPYCGWTVTTHYGGKSDPMDKTIIRSDADAFVGAIYDTRLNEGASRGEDWGASVPTQVPSSWTVSNIGQVYGVATDSDNNIFLASSDIYARNNWNGKTLESGNISRPSSCTQIYKCMSPNFDPVPFASLPNNCEALNGIGNIAYDYINNQLFASNLEDGKIYRISAAGIQLDSYDPWSLDDGVAGIAPLEERIWGIGVNVEDGNTKLYFPRTLLSGITSMFELTLAADGSFPPPSSESVAVPTLNGSMQVISDIAFSIDGQKMIYSEYGDIQNSKVWAYELSSGGWQANNAAYHVGNNTGLTGGNSAGGLDFGPISDGVDASGRCDELIWTTGKSLEAIAEIGELAGLQGIAYGGNNQFAANDAQSNAGTDLFIDLDGYYVDPCDVSSSLVNNAGFEILDDPSIVPTQYSQLNRALNWVQATDATSDLFQVGGFEGANDFTHPIPPNGSQFYAGGWYIKDNFGSEYVEYIGACLQAPILPNQEYSISMLLGATGANSQTSPEIDISLVVLGIPDCNFPIAGNDCKEDNFQTIATIPLNIQASTWQSFSTTFTTAQQYPAIMFGLQCDQTSKFDRYYFVVDDIILTQGEPCTGNEVIKDFPGDVELFKCEGCFGPETLNTYIK